MISSCIYSSICVAFLSRHYLIFDFLNLYLKSYVLLIFIWQYISSISVWSKKKFSAIFTKSIGLTEKCRNFCNELNLLWPSLHLSAYGYKCRSTLFLDQLFSFFFLLSTNNGSEGRRRKFSEKECYFSSFLTQSSTLAFWQIGEELFNLVKKYTERFLSPFFFRIGLPHRHRTGIWLMRCMAMTLSDLRCEREVASAVPKLLGNKTYVYMYIYIYIYIYDAEGLPNCLTKKWIMFIFLKNVPRYIIICRQIC